MWLSIKNPYTQNKNGVVQVTMWLHVGVSHEKQHSSPTEHCVGDCKVKGQQ